MKRYLRADGYVLVYENHKLIYEHRKVLEKKIGRKLYSDEIAHHKNENKSDNSPDNLELKSRSNHTRDHQIPAPVVLRKCGSCGRQFERFERDVREATKLGRRTLFCSRSCAAKAPRIKKNSYTHGTKSAYSYHGCRCSICKLSNARRAREYRQGKSKRP